MNDIPLTAFFQTIEAAHRARSQITAQVPVEQARADGSLWSGHVLVFDLLDHPHARRCYAWELGGRVTIVLETEGVRSPLDAVRSWLDQEGGG